MAKQLKREGGPGVRVRGEVIRTARIAKGMSQQDLATACEWSDANMVYRIEKRNTASPESLKKLVMALDIPIESVLVPRSDTSGYSRGVFQLPPSLPDFTGREDELARITSRLRGAGGSVGISSALRGMGGVGKTVTAIEACYEVKDDFPDGQLVVELRGMSEQPMTAAQAMAQLIRDFHPEAGKLPDDEAQLQALYRQVLDGKKALVLLDDAKDEAQVRALLCVPSVAFVVTSRHTLALDGVESIRLGVLPLDEAFTLLRGIIGAKGMDDELRVVAELCGRLPLALRVAGDFLRLHENWSLPKYTAALQDESQRLDRLKGKSPDRDVEAVLALSARELVCENPERAERWQMLSVFPADFTTQAAAAVWDLKSGDKPDTDTTENELTALLDRSLVQYEADTDRYSLHDLMRPVARATFEYVEGHPLQPGAADRIATADQRFAGFYCQILNVAQDLYLKGNDEILRGLALFDREEANIRHGQAWAVRNRASSRTAAELCHDYPNSGAYVIDLRLSAHERIAWLGDSISACREIGDRRGEGAALCNLGLAWAALGDARKSVGFYEQSMVITREIGDRLGEGATLGNLGLAWAALGDARKAVGFYEQQLVITREIGDRRGKGNALGSLGNAWAALGDARKAVGFYEQALVVAREIGDRRGEGSSLGNLGIVWAALGDARKAVGFYEQRLVIAREIGDRRGEGSSLGNLGTVWSSLGDARKALGFYEQHLAVAREIGDRRGEGTALGNLGTVWYSLGDARKALGFYEQHLAVAREIGDRRGEGNALGNLGVAWKNLGDVRKAVTFYEQHLAVAREIGDRLGEGAALGNLGNAWADLGDARKAVGFHEKNLAVAREIGDRRGEGNSLLNMAVILQQLEQPTEAIRLAEHALAIYTEIESPNAEKARQAIAKWRGEAAT